MLIPYRSFTWQLQDIVIRSGQFHQDCFKTERLVCIETNGHSDIASARHPDQEYIYFMWSDTPPSMRCKLPFVSMQTSLSALKLSWSNLVQICLFDTRSTYAETGRIGSLYHIAAIGTIGSKSTSKGFYRALQGYPNFGAPKLPWAIFLYLTKIQFWKRWHHLNLISILE